MAYERLLAFEASAGSGKTFNLVVRYLSLLFMDVEVEKIVALTFTNKAAHEMQSRVLQTLRTLEERGELAVIVDVTGLDAAQILERRERVLYRFLNAHNKIMTIDSFFAAILRRFSLHAGLMPTFSTFERQHEDRLMRRFLNELNVNAEEETLLRLSEISTKRLSSLFELLEELYAKMPELGGIHFEDAPYEGVVETAMAQLARLYALFDLESLSPRAQKSLHVSSIEELASASWMLKESLNYWDFRKQYRDEMDVCLSDLKETLRRYMQHKEQRFFHALLALLERYKKSRFALSRQDGELSFDDITAWVHYLLQERIDRDFLYFRLDSRIEHLLLDEFQDTSVVQFDILRPIVDEIVAGQGAKETGSFFFVGDVKQSIYRFRGGVSALFDEVATRYRVKREALSVNYRSSAAVVTFVNSVFERRMSHYIPQSIKPNAPEGYVEVISDEAVLERCVATVRMLLDADVPVDDIAVLCATNADGSAVEEALKAVDVEVVTETTSKLIRRRRVAALIEAVKYGYYGAPIYAANFFALLGIEPEVLGRCNDPRARLHEYVKGVIERFDVFGGDINVLRFLELLERYEDIEAFLFEYERLDAAAIQTDVHGVRVLTVHKSKGLEFRHVIVMDRIGRPHAPTQPIIYAYEGTKLRGLFLRQKNRALFDPEYARALEMEAQALHVDALNALYVALTRAEQSLFVIQKPEHSAFGMLELQSACYGALQIEMRVKQAPQTEPTVLSKVHGLGRQSDVIAQPKSYQGDYGAVVFGLALHYTLEMMGDFDLPSLNEALRSTRNRYGTQLSQSAFAAIKERILGLFESAAFNDLVNGVRYKEQPLSYCGEIRYLDLLVRHAQGWRVIDYKSGIQECEAHLKQLAFYVEAVGAITGGPVSGHLCYLLADSVEIVSL